MSSVAQYRICPSCSRAVPIDTKEHYCINDGVLLLEKCPKCNAGICSPYARHCAGCGYDFGQAVTKTPPVSASQVSKTPTPRRSLGAPKAMLLIGIVAGLLITTGFKRPTEIKMVFVGKIPQSRAFVAIAVQQQRALAYVCDGQSIAEWFKGPVSEQHTLELQSKSGALLVASLNGQGARGSIQLPQGHFVFAAMPARDRAALYRAERNGGHKVVAGWIVLPDGQQHGAIVDPSGVRLAPALETANGLMPVTSLGLMPKIVNPHDPNGFRF